MSNIKVQEELHKYAPELNRIHFFKGTKRVGTIKETCLLKYRSNIRRVGRCVRQVQIEFYYDDPEYQYLNRTISGTASYKYIREFINHRLAQNPGGLLLNGDYLPALKYRIKSIKMVEL